MAPHQFVTLFTWDTIQSADSTEWCPLAPYESIFVCGTYQIEQTGEDVPKGQDVSPAINRIGTINVFNMVSLKKFELHQELHVSAVLDMKWCHTRILGKVILAVVTAMGELIVYELQDNLNLEVLAAHRITSQSPGEILALSLDWSTGKALKENVNTSEINIVVSDSKGGVNLFHLDEFFSLKQVKNWHGHDHETWIACFNCWEPTNLFSGGDDCKLKGWDIRKGFDSPTFTNNSHEAGVTSLHSNAHHQYILASGSYDENLRLWDLRHMKHPLHTTKLQGGVWRLKWDPHCFKHLLAACMYGGFSVITCFILEEPTVVATYKNHDSIAYGSDWCYLSYHDLLSKFPEDMLDIPGSNNDAVCSVVSTCSFYDHRMCVSLLKPQ